MEFDFIPDELRADPGSQQFIQIAERFLAEEKYLETIYVCMLGLTHNPEHHEGRMLLAHAFYRCGLIPFAVREVELLMKKLPGLETLPKLLQKLAPEHVIQSDGSSDEETLAEGEFDLGELDLLEED